MNNIPGMVLQEVKQKWNVKGDELNFQELPNEWVVWRRVDQDKAGSLRLIIPKNGKNSFEIPSNYIADADNGVSGEYVVQLLSVTKPLTEATRVLGAHTGIPNVEAYKAMRIMPTKIGPIYIEEPLKLLKEMKKRGVSMRLIRPGDCGGYGIEDEKP